MVWNELVESRVCFGKLRLHSRAVLISTFALLMVGMLLFLLLENDGVFSAMSIQERIPSAFFQSVTPRTAGFNTVDMAALSEGGKFVTMMLMFIGAAPGGTGGGIKVTTMVVMAAAVLASLRNREDVSIWHFRLETEILRRAFCGVSVYLAMTVCGVLVLCAQGQLFTDAAFECLSAIGTVGLSTGITQTLPEGQQLLIIQAVCTQLGIALERETLVADREKIRLAMVREQQRGTLLRSVAHDLRSPLTALSGAGNLLADNYQELSESKRRKLASDISEEIVWLTDLVENILSMTRIREQKIVLHKQDEVIDDVIGEAVKHMERLIRGRSFQVKLPEEVVTAPMDGKLFSQVIINLLENAVRHTPPEIAIMLTVQADNQLIVSVVDTGGGIPAAIRGHLFERFVTQDEEIVDGRRGLGLGLSICKAIIVAHGGEIFVADCLGARTGEREDSST